METPSSKQPIKDANCRSGLEEGPTQSSDFTDWTNIPQTILENIFLHLERNQMLHASVTCSLWRQALYSPNLWRILYIVVESKNDANKLKFLSRIAKYGIEVTLIWKFRKHITTRSVKQIDLLQKEAILLFMTALAEGRQVRKLKFQLENPWAHHVDVITNLKKSVHTILKNNHFIEFLSFGGNLNIAPNCFIEDMHGRSTSCLKELHISNFDQRALCQCDMKSFYSSGKLGSEESFVFDSTPLKLFQNPQNILSMAVLKEMSTGFGYVNQPSLEAFNGRNRASKLEKLNLSVCTHRCHSNLHEQNQGTGTDIQNIYHHPNEEQWSEFGSLNPSVKVRLIFAGSVKGICQGLQLIQPGVSSLKLLEYQAVEPDVLGLGHRDTLRTLVYCCVWNPVMLENGDELWPYVSQCLLLEHIVFIGHYIPDEAVFFIAHYFEERLQTLLASHLISFAETTDYMVPISAGRYNAIKSRLSQILSKRWEALTKIPLTGYYFNYGKDDSFFENGLKHWSLYYDHVHKFTI